MPNFDWINFLLDPYNVFMVGSFSTVLWYSLSAAICYTFGVRRQLGIRISLFIGLMGGLLVWGFGYFIVIWYNTPMGPPLNLVR